MIINGLIPTLSSFEIMYLDVNETAQLILYAADLNCHEIIFSAAGGSYLYEVGSTAALRIHSGYIFIATEEML